MKQKISRRMFVQLTGSASVALLGSRPAAPGPARAPAQRRRLPYPNSTVVSDLEWLAPASRYPGTNSDMHWWTWSADGSLLLVDEDGRNFGSDRSNKNLLKVTGTPPDYKIVALPLPEALTLPGPDRDANGHPRGQGMNDELNPAQLRYPCGALSVGQRLYVAVSDYDMNVPGVDRHLLNHVSLHGGIVGIMYSDDGAKTWNNVPLKEWPDSTHPYFLGPRFAGLQFVGFGPGYTGVPQRLEGYVYAISNDISWASGDNLFLARVPRDQVLDRSAWEFYAGEGKGHQVGEPAWVKPESLAKPIFSDPQHVGHSDLSFNHALNRYFLSVFSDVVPHTLAATLDVAEAQWNKRSELQIYEGPAPWGPWSLVHDDPNWEGPKHAPYLPKLPSKWWSPDGLSGVLLFAGDYANSISNDDPDTYYGVVTRPFRLKLRAHQ